MKKEHAKRLLFLADFLEALPPKSFDLQCWSNRLPTEDGKVQPRCGTTACALGWTPSIPQFFKLGARLATNRAGEVFPYLKGGRKGDAAPKRLSRELFGLSEDDHAFLFLPSHYPTVDPSREDVSQRIRMLVAARMTESPDARVYSKSRAIQLAESLMLKNV